ncbi:MAG: proton-conducting transporter membrane subunit [Candidatus Gracilibacteria bacterium]|nr:proton-conducting transporter membrane subunit [Candidatus Gracilibacteria bacterium]
METLFYTSILTPLVLALIALFLDKNYGKAYLQINKYIYFVLAIIATYFWVKGVRINTSFFILDNISIIFYSIIFILSFLISIYAVNYFKTEIDHKVIGRGRLKQYNVMINFFILSMIFIAISKNLMIMWIALEATTIFSAFLISFYGTKSSWEAAWKYVILCGLGVTIGLFGLFMMVMSGVHSLDFTVLAQDATINKNLLKLAFVFIFIGFGTKVGFFPLNNWLPDAHGKGSTPVSAFMSSILLPLAFYMIIRCENIVNFYLNYNFTSKIMIFFSFITIIYSGFVMITQHHYKRALAYSSSENMGIIAFAWALGTPLAQTFSLLHVIGHSFLKTASFMSAGNILLYTHTGQFNRIKEINKYMRNSSVLLIISLFMLVGLPPSPLFISELGIIWQAYTINPWFALVFISGIVLAFVGLLYNFSSLFISKDNEELIDMKRIDKDFKITSMHTPIIFALILALITSIIFVANFKF